MANLGSSSWKGPLAVWGAIYAIYRVYIRNCFPPKSCATLPEGSSSWKIHLAKGPFSIVQLQVTSWYTCCTLVGWKARPRGHLHLVDTIYLGWEIHSEFRGIPRLIRFRTFWTPKFSSEFYFSDHKMCSRQFWTIFFRFGILSRHLFFWFHESEMFPPSVFFRPTM